MEKSRYALTLSKKLMEDVTLEYNKGGYDSVSAYVESAIKDKLNGVDNTFSDIIDIDNEIQENRNSHTKVEEISYHKANDLYERKNTKLTLDHIISDSKAMFSKRNFSEDEFDPSLIHIKNGDKDSLLAWNFNRYFPLKVTLRVLVNLMKAHEVDFSRISLEKFGHFYPEDFDVISKIGVPFKYSDDLIGRKRGDAFSTGFPIFDIDSEVNSKKAHRTRVSTDRFITIFVIDYRAATNEVYGALTKLGFISAWRNNKDGGMIIKLTRKGKEFNDIINPVIDNNEGLNDRKISSLCKEEVSYLINHIKENLPNDYNAMTSLLELIKNNHNTQDKLKKAISKDLEWKKIKDNIQKQFKAKGKKMDIDRLISRVQNHMNAVIARSTEMGLVEKHKEATSVKYKLSESGKNLILGR